LTGRRCLPSTSVATFPPPKSDCFPFPSIGGPVDAVKVCRYCSGPLTGRQRDWCSAKCRVAATRTAQTRTRTPRTPPPPVGIVGQRDPLFRLVPENTTGSRGQEVIDLAKQAGIELDPWQEDWLKDGLSITPNGKWGADDVVTLVPRQNGKSVVLVLRGLWGAAVAGETVVFSSHQYKSAAECFRLAKALCETEAFRAFNPRIQRAHGAEGIEFASGGRLLFIARSRVSGRGFSPSLVICDEAFELSDLDLSSLRPSLAASESPQTWFASSAPHDTSTVLRRLAVRGRSGEAERMVYEEWCADPKLAASDLEAIRQANPALGTRIEMQTVLAELDVMTEADFRRERLGFWQTDAVVGVFGAGTWQRLADVNVEVPTKDPVRVLGVDVQPDRESACVAAATVLGDGRIFVEVLDNQPGAHWVPGKVKELVGEGLDPSPIVLDAIGPAGSLVEPLREAVWGAEIHAIDTTEMTSACALLWDGVLSGRVIHRGQPVLDEAVAVARKRPVGERWAWGRRTSAGSIAPLVAASLAYYGVTNANVRPWRGPLVI
jgi:hypothetical protein